MKHIKLFLKHLQVSLIRYISDCDGMCGRYDVCRYCESNKKELK